ncbi:MAG: enoyl-CoA hydratase-related protein [Eubacteriales bacterium]|nr:enoyl-CoA hydratase-related protein [Eubacteriales bacterium]
MSTVLYEKKGHVGLITLNNPKKLNALSAAFMTEIENAVAEVEKDTDVYVCIITGVEKAFIAGADISEMCPLTAAGAIAWGKQGTDLNLRIENLRVPVIAAVNGFALGGGCELAMACDIRIASEKAKFGQPEVGLGITPGAGGTQRLPRLVGAGIAKELLYTGRMINAQEAYRIGLVNKVTAPEELMDAAFALADEIIKNAQIAVQQTKRCVNRGIETDIVTGIDFEQQAFAVCNATEDKQIGMGAFLRKEKEKNFVYR